MALRSERGIWFWIGMLLLATSAAKAQQTNPANPPPQAQPPLPNRANEQLPGWLRVRGEFRSRLEWFTGAGFTSGRDDLYWLNRVRLNVAVRPSRLLTFEVQAQDARVGGKEVGPTGPPFRDAFDLRMAYAEVGDSQKNLVTARIGRQELVFGEQRLIGHTSWLNTARTFDGVRFTIHRPRYQLDAFASSVVRIQDGTFNKSGYGNRVLGVHGTSRTVVRHSVVEAYLFLKRDPNLHSATIGTHWTGELPFRLDYGIEIAAQTGSAGSDTIRAWAGHWQLGETIASDPKLRLIGEYNYASGDRDPSDGRRGTFDQLYPTAHDKYGLADQVGWRNIHDLRLGSEITPTKGWQLTGNYHSWWLADTHDGLYNAAGALIASFPGGSVASHVGEEFDVQLLHALSPQISLAGGYSRIFPGEFLKQATPGAKFSFPYFMVTYIFLAEK